MVARILAVAAAFIYLPTAHAQQKKTEKFDLSGVEQQKLEKHNVERGKTRITRNEAFIIATEDKLLSEIEKAIAYLDRTYKRMPPKSTARLEMREKLLNLRLEAAVYHGKQEMRRYDKAWEAWDRGGRRGREPKLDNSRSRREWATLSQEAASLLTEFPRSKNADNTMFNMGLAKSFLGQEKEAARIFSQLIAKYPNSQKAGDAYFALGDFYFDRTDFRNAMNNYKNALRFKQSKAYAWALFKLGWCSYNLGSYQNALSYWKQTVTAANRSGKQGLALKEEAMRDMVYAFAELRQVEPAIEYYRRNGGHQYIGRFLILLSNTFSDQGRYADAIKVLKRYQQVAPYDEGTPDTQKEIIQLNYELDRLPTVWAELARFPQLYGPKSAWGARWRQKNKKRYLEVQQLIKDQILYYAKLTHKTAQKDDDKRRYAEAMKGYRLYLKNYPQSREVAEVKYLMADIEYFAKNYREAGKLYLEICLLGQNKAVIYDPKTNKAENIHQKSANYMLDAFATDFEPEYKVLLKRQPDFNKPPVPLTPRAKNFIKACGYYTKWYPKDTKTAKRCDVYITQVFYKSQNKKESLKWLWLIAKKYPGSPEGNEAVENLIPLYGNDKAALKKAAEELLKMPAYAKGKLGRKLRDLAEGLELESIMAMKNRCKRGEALEAKYKKNPRAKEADKLIFNAGGDYLTCGDVGKAIAAYEIVLSRHPNSEGYQDALLAVAKLRERRVELGEAAEKYLMYARKYPKDKLALGALAKACELQAALDSQAAVGTCLAFGEQDQAGAKLVFMRMIRAANSANDHGKLQSLVRTFNSKFRTTPEEVAVTNGFVYQATRSAAAAQQIMAAFRAANGNLQGEALRYVGGIVFRDVNGEMDRYLKFRLQGGTVDALAASIQNKVAALQKVQAAYQQVLQTGDAYWGVAALYQLGYAHEVLANDLSNPPEIKGAPHEDVVKQLAPDAKAAANEARAFYAKALESVPKYMVYNEWAAKARSGMARISGRNIEFEDIIVTPDFLGAEVPESVARAVRSGAGI